MSNKDKNDNKDLFKNVTSNKITRKDLKKIIKQHRSKKNIAIISVCAVVLLGLLVTGGTYGMQHYKSADVTSSKLSGNNTAYKTNDSETKSTASSQSTVKQAKVVNKVKDETKLPVKLAKWQKTSYSSEAGKATTGSKANQTGKNINSSNTGSSQSSYSTSMMKDFKSYLQSSSPQMMSLLSSLPSSSNGFTDDVSKATNSDGTPNNKYSYLTAENTEYAYSQYINRLLNPVFGDWYTLQYKEGKDNLSVIPQNTLGDMFTQSWWDKNVGQSSTPKFPIYADWNGNDYNNTQFAENSMASGRWYGKVTSEDVKVSAESDGSGNDYIVNDNVTFYALDKDEKVMTKTGTLYLKLVPNHDSTDIYHRLLIDDAKLQVN